MKLLVKSMIIASIMAIMNTNISTASETTLNVVPAVTALDVDSTQHFTITRGMGVWSCAEGLPAASYLIDYCNDKLGLPLQLVSRKDDAGIVFDKETIGCRPHYALCINEKGIMVSATEAESMFNGMTTIIQMLPTRPGDLPQLPHTILADSPEFNYRGMHMDVVRHFSPVSFIKQFIDWMALHKLNVFHWHLTDDQGWRVEIKSHPELTERGSYRRGEIKGVFPGEYYDRPFQAYYTQEEIKDVINYAAERYITVMPEIDIPGHCMAVLAAHPEFSTTPNEPKHTAETWGIFNRQNNVLAPSNEVFKFLSEVFNEVCELFPSHYIHVGGDECAPKWWNESEATQQFMREHGIKDTHEMQTYFMRHVQDVCKAHGREVIGWDGGAEGLDPETGIIESWHMRPQMPKERIDTLHKWINASGYYHYFTSHEDSLQTEIAPGDRALTVKQVYEGALVPDAGDEQVARNLIGIEGCIWTEYCAEPWKIEMQVFPRLAALAEKAWCGDNRPGWANFEPRLMRQLDRYDLWRVRYNTAFERHSTNHRSR